MPLYVYSSFLLGYSIDCCLRGIYGTLKEGKRSLSEKNIQNALWQYQKSHDMKFRAMDVL
jgi:hypothetical protein